MRLHFWAARESGLLQDGSLFGDYYVRLIGHFVSVYERTAPPFARESARWSLDPVNIAAYVAAGKMPGIDSVSLRDALLSLPAAERDYTGSSANPRLWPYEMVPL